ncbi:hypothetical protein E2P81_ATG00095 [Venturia nashicola]|uniref:Uncharacterized protein n=1 Tax=Venturia nashicola TaxID=86259 RepID=A0A4Z1PCW2_9PEZI|nr:hypothetical protein E6O75_ATG00102 [Venturia nashicola]TLD39108.1 hypothetical protein E2P81_ATG00095 [Venturia nashicola]
MISASRFHHLQVELLDLQGALPRTINIVTFAADDVRLVLRSDDTRMPGNMRKASSFGRAVVVKRSQCLSPKSLIWIPLILVLVDLKIMIDPIRSKGGR